MTPDEYVTAQTTVVDELAAAYARIKAGDPAARVEFWKLVEAFWTRQVQWGHRVGLV